MIRLAPCIAIVLVLVGAPRSAAQPAELAPPDLEARIGELRIEGNYEEAARVARLLLEARTDDASTPGFKRADAQRLVAILEDIARRDPDERKRLARAESLTSAAGDFLGRGLADDALAAADTALAIRQAILGTRHLDVAHSLTWLAYAEMLSGNDSGAEAHFRESLNAMRENLGDDHPDVAITLNNLAYIFAERSDYSTAEPLYRQALVVTRQCLGERSAEVAMCLNNLAMARRYDGDFAAAEPLSREALAIVREALGPRHPDVASSLNNLAQVLQARGDYSAAEPLLREAISIWKETLGDGHPMVAVGQNNLAALLDLMGDHEAALPLYLEALASKRKHLSADDPDLATTLSNFGTHFFDVGNHASAVPLYEEALGIQVRRYGQEHNLVAYTKNNLGMALHGLGENDRAEQFLEEAVSTWRSVLGNEHYRVVLGTRNLAIIEIARGNRARAESLLVAAAATYESARLRAGIGLARSSFVQSPYALLATTRLELGRTAEAWEATERDLGRSLVDLLIAAKRHSESSAEAAREDSLRNTLRELESRLAAFRKAAQADSSEDARTRVEAARSQLLNAEAEWSGHQRDIALRYPAAAGQACSLEELQNAFGAGTALIGWLDVEEREGVQASWGYVIRKSGPVRWTKLGLSDHESPPAETAEDPSGTNPGGTAAWESAALFRSSLATPNSAMSSADNDAADVYAERIAPLLSSLGEVTDLVVVPSGPMLGLPVEALRDKTGIFVGERYAVSYAPSATIFARLARKQSTRETESSRDLHSQGEIARALFIGDPPFNATQLADMSGRRAEATAATDGDSGSMSSPQGPSPSDPPARTSVAGLTRSALRGNQDALAQLERLPETREEVESLADLWPGSRILLGRDASEQALAEMVRTGELEDFRLLHFATHALLDDERGEGSALALSRVDLPDPLRTAETGGRMYDGLISTKEILQSWTLDADLVTLSACQTALGREVAGEGFVGLAHAFLQAGARGLLVSSWKVDDRATRLLMRRFYENWSGGYHDARMGHRNRPMSKAAALQEAKTWLREYRDTRGEQPYAHPYYWSSFILIGNRS